nr:uncharacterized protein LOC107034794 [Vicugna pacos]
MFVVAVVKKIHFTFSSRVLCLLVSALVCFHSTLHDHGRSLLLAECVHAGEGDTRGFGDPDTLEASSGCREERREKPLADLPWARAHSPSLQARDAISGKKKKKGKAAPYFIGHFPDHCSHRCLLARLREPPAFVFGLQKVRTGTLTWLGLVQGEFFGDRAALPSTSSHPKAWKPGLPSLACLHRAPQMGETAFRSQKGSIVLNCSARGGSGRGHVVTRAIPPGLAPGPLGQSKPAGASGLTIKRGPQGGPREAGSWGSLMLWASVCNPTQEKKEQ